MTWRLRVQHRTGYTYDGSVYSSFNEARMTPLTDAVQTTLDSRIEVTPATSLYRYRDYWGTQVTSFDIQQPHTELVVTATSIVETHSRAEGNHQLSWGDLAGDKLRDTHTEWLSVTKRTDPDGDLANLAADSAGSLAPGQAAIACVQAALAQMEYVPGSTGVHTNGLEAWQARRGVCQDFAHVSLAMLRSLGIPCRYVSGYLHPVAQAQIGQSVKGESHAWIEWFDGSWVDFDATSGKVVGEQYVAVAKGRDYDDVTPLKGTFAGAKSSKLGVVVELNRLA